ncbi:MAG TPA: hypothetical protein VGO76_00110 [Luteibacter sp.]|jgi:hypothetical protein|nr:hypothetical protein [Luteibacter sp.]
MIRKFLIMEHARALIPLFEPVLHALVRPDGLRPGDGAQGQNVKLLKDSAKWEQPGTPGDRYEHEVFRYTGAMPSGCGYTLEIRQGIIPNDFHHRYRVSTSLTW